MTVLDLPLICSNSFTSPITHSEILLRKITQHIYGMLVWCWSHCPICPLSVTNLEEWPCKLSCLRCNAFIKDPGDPRALCSVPHLTSALFSSLECSCQPWLLPPINKLPLLLSLNRTPSIFHFPVFPQMFCSAISSLSLISSIVMVLFSFIIFKCLFSHFNWT